MFGGFCLSSLQSLNHCAFRSHLLFSVLFFVLVSVLFLTYISIHFINCSGPLQELVSFSTVFLFHNPPPPLSLSLSLLPFPISISPSLSDPSPCQLSLSFLRLQGVHCQSFTHSYFSVSLVSHSLSGFCYLQRAKS